MTDDPHIPTKVVRPSQKLKPTKCSFITEKPLIVYTAGPGLYGPPASPDNFEPNISQYFLLEFLLQYVNPLNPELNPICFLLALLAHHFLHVSRIRVKSLILRVLMSYIYMEPLFLMFLDHTQRRSTVGRTPLYE